MLSLILLALQGKCSLLISEILGKWHKVKEQQMVEQKYEPKGIYLSPPVYSASCMNVLSALISLKGNSSARR